MKVVNINSGLGNQMLAYCVVLAMRQANPKDKVYVETIIYDIPECNEVVSQWNGYELERIFGIQTPNVKELFKPTEWDSILSEIRKSEFWNKKWNYAPYITKAFSNAGIVLVNKKGDYLDSSSHNYKHETPLLKAKIQWLMNHTWLGYKLKEYIKGCQKNKLIRANSHPERLFLSTDKDIYTGMWLDFKFKANNIELIHDDIIRVFKFPDFDDEKNLAMMEFLQSNNSVFIHARMGDLMSMNGSLYKYGYFKRAVKLIRKKVDKPVFVFFTNTGSIQWCKEHATDIFGLKQSDIVKFVDWNGGNQSFRDMQLMSYCKHGIITNSTFGWWGAYLIQNPQKITVSPNPSINTTHFC